MDGFKQECFSQSRPLQFYPCFQLVLQESQAAFSHTCRQRKGPLKLVSRGNSQKQVCDQTLCSCSWCLQRALSPPVSRLHCTQHSRVKQWCYNGSGGKADRTLESILGFFLTEDAGGVVRGRIRVGLSGFDSPRNLQKRGM